ncbi:MAG: tyrosine protein phosphatase [Pseudomonadota bacterium]
MSAIHVCPLEKLNHVLAISGPCRLLTLCGPGKETAPPSHAEHGFLQLVFNDINEPREGLIAPDESHVKAIIDFVTIWDRKVPLVIHCWMGISRSTAAALIASAALYPQAPAEGLASLLRSKSPMATPNRLMVEHADTILGRKGELVDAVDAIGRGQDAMLGEPFTIALGELRALSDAMAAT